MITAFASFKINKNNICKHTERERASVRSATEAPPSGGVTLIPYSLEIKTRVLILREPGCFLFPRGLDAVSYDVMYTIRWVVENFFLFWTRLTSPA